MPVSKRKRQQGQWFHAGKSLNWSKEDGQSKRRRAALASRRGNYLKAGRALQSLANVTQDRETKSKASADAKYFFMKHERSGK